MSDGDRISKVSKDVTLLVQGQGNNCGDIWGRILTYLGFWVYV